MDLFIYLSVSCLFSFFFLYKQDSPFLSPTWSPYWNKGRNLGWWRERCQMVNMQVSDRGLGREGRCKVAAKVVMKRLPCTWGGCPGHQGIVPALFLSSYTLKDVRMCAKSLQSCPAVCDPVDCSLPTSSVHGILQARILEWVYMPSSSGSFLPRNQAHISCISGGFFTTEPLGTPYFYLNLESSSFTLLSCLWTELYSFLDFFIEFLSKLYMHISWRNKDLPLSIHLHADFFQ